MVSPLLSLIVALIVWRFSASGCAGTPRPLSPFSLQSLFQISGLHHCIFLPPHKNHILFWHKLGQVFRLFTYRCGVWSTAVLLPSFLFYFSSRAACHIPRTTTVYSFLVKLLLTALTPPPRVHTRNKKMESPVSIPKQLCVPVQTIPKRCVAKKDGVRSIRVIPVSLVLPCLR